nr:coagulation factor V-like [Ipomoea batatas]
MKSKSVVFLASTRARRSSEQPSTIANSRISPLLPILPFVAVDREPEAVAPDREPEAVAADREPEVVAADREPEVVAADREPEAVAIDREPEAVTVDREPEAVAADREPEAVAADREPEAIAAIAVHREPATGAPQTAVGSVASPRKDLPCRQSRFRRLLFLLQFRFQCSRLAEGTGQRRNMKWKSKLGYVSLQGVILCWSHLF